MLMLSLDRTISTPLYLQIRDGIVALIEEGALRAGARLPPSRALARANGVHRSTVVRAYDEIRALGYLESRSGSYTTVRLRPRPLATRSKGCRASEAPLVDWLDRTAPAVRCSHEARLAELRPPQRNDVIDLERLSSDPALAPTAALRHCVRAALLRDGPVALDYADTTGWPALREAISTRLRSHGVAASPEEILVTAGAQQALDLALRLLTRPGDRVAVEAPTYPMAHALLRLHDLVPVEIPMREDGMDLDALDRGLRDATVRLVYTMPNFQNPTGVSTDQTHRERLLATCERRRVPIVEDGFQEEMKYFGRAVLPIKSIDARGIVLYIGTFSKVVFPGLRVGWIAAAGEAIALLESIQHAACLCGNTLAQAAAERFCRGGELETYLRRTHRVYRGRMQAALGALRRHMPEGTHWTHPTGGYTLWLTLPGGGALERSWHQRFLEAGVLVAPGSRFFAAPPEQCHFRLSIACADEEQIEEGCRRLGSVAGTRRLRTV